jgi:D-aminoacyl-tRNA deacylase
MITVIQRVTKGSVTINQMRKEEIGIGLVVLVGIEEADTQEDIDWLATKLINLRIFDDDQGVMNLSVKEAGGDVLLISQFTLLASTKKGNRPSYSKAAKPDIAVPLYEKFIVAVGQNLGKPIYTGEFGADMLVEIHNNGPVTILIDSKNKA